MQKTIFNITKMDCPSEEQLIRMKLQKFDEIKSLEFDIQNRKLTVHHIAESQPILSALETLNLDTTLISTEESTSRNRSRHKQYATKIIVDGSHYQFSVFRIGNAVWYFFQFNGIGSRQFGYAC
jgi:cation transport ATPase